MVEILVVAKITFFLLWINLLPPLAHLLLGKRFACRVDGGLLFIDKQPLFGSHKTVRGIVASVLGGTVAAFAMSVPWWIASLAALMAMVGDLASSFVKRRLRKAVGSSVFILDQFFEALFPLFILNIYVPLQWWQMVAVLVVFIPLAYLGACFWQYLSSHPHQENYPRLIKSSVRFREWRSCHEPLARWQTVLNLTSFLSDQIFLTLFFKLTGLHSKGMENALNLRIEEEVFEIGDLPRSFDGFRILLLTDLHLDGLQDLTGNIINHVRETKFDICLIGGDIRMKIYGPLAPSLRHLRKLVPEIKSVNGIYGVLGNHDCIEMTPELEEVGVTMLINDAWPVEKGNDRLWIVGLDDPHYYKTDNVERALRDVPPGENVILLAHSPEAYRDAADHGTKLYLCGHTHGGQICLPGSGPLLTNSRAPRFTASGRWQYGNMAGYTSRGVGASGIPLRFNCPGEISVITLRRAVGNDE